jgi:predicted dithiol-disulfide oxidoreductase (DUF899 family)
MANTTPHPDIVSQQVWRNDRKELLMQEKQLTQHQDEVNAQRRRLPMVQVEKNCAFAAYL